MSYLVSAFKSEADLSLAYEAMDDDWPGGQAHLVVTALKEVYQPSDSITEVELYEKLNKVEMKKKDDLKSLFEQIAKIKNWYNNGNCWAEAHERKKQKLFGSFHSKSEA